MTDPARAALAMRVDRTVKDCALLFGDDSPEVEIAEVLRDAVLLGGDDAYAAARVAPVTMAPALAKRVADRREPIQN